MWRGFRAQVAGALIAAGVSVLGAPAEGAELPSQCTSSGLEVLCVFAKPSAKPVAFLVPEGVSSIDAFVQGGAGGDGPPDTSFGGRGGTARAVLLVHPGDALDLRVGGRGGNAAWIGGQPAKGGINGGGAAGDTGAGGGGGRTEIHARNDSAGQQVSVDPLTTDPLIAAGGGGGAGAGPDRRSNGGNGGGSIGAAGLATSANQAGQGATERGGGEGGGRAHMGTRGVGGSGVGPGGGGGYFGGGGGDQVSTGLAAELAGGGGGGSGYGLPGTVFGLAPAGGADGIIYLRFKRLLLGVDIARVCDADAPAPAGWILREGTDGADVLVGSGVNELFRGRLGNDRISGRGGDDILCGDNGADVLRGGAGNDLVLGGRGRDRLDGGTGEDRGIDLDAGTRWIAIESRA